MEDKHVSIHDDYENLRCHKGKLNNQMRKVNSERKLTEGILKKKTRKKSQFNPKEKKSSKTGITWDNTTINEQKKYRENHPLDKEKLKSSYSKYSGKIEVIEDVYTKGLNKVNEINNDELIFKIFNNLSDNYGKKKCLKRNKSCLMFGKYKGYINLKDFYNITEKEKLFDDSLGQEQKLTLQNTLYNKINKEIIEK